MSVSKQQLKFVLMALVNLVIFYFLYQWLLNSVNFLDFKRSLLHIPVEAISIALFLGLLSLLFYGLRLSCLIDKTFSTSFWIVCYGFGANNILPFRMGDVLKLYFARKYYQVPATKLVFVKIMEKMFDLSFLLLIGGLALLLGVAVIEGKHVMLVAAVLIVMTLGFFLVLFLLRRDFQVMVWLRKNLLISRLLRHFEEVIMNPALKRAMLITAVIWLVTVVMMFAYYSLALMDYQLGVNDALALVFITTLSLGLPSAPGGLGVFEAGTVFYLSKFVDVPADLALAVALVLHLIVALPQIFLMFAAIIASRLTTEKLC